MRGFICTVALLASLNLTSRHEPPKSESARLADEFLASLGTDLLKKTQFQFGDDYRTNWNYVPMDRKGAHIGDMTEIQFAKATKLLRASLSDLGYRKIERIRELEDVLFEMEGRNATRDKKLYCFSVFGDPDDKAKWGWRYEGHHVSLNFTYKDGKLIASTPQFLGTNPAEVRSGPKKGERVLAKEQDLAFVFLDSLSVSQRQEAVISITSPNEIITGNQRKAGIQKQTGIRYADLDSDQRLKLIKLIEAHAEVQRESEQKRRLKTVEPTTIVFAWMGSLVPGKGHYYRIQGSKFLIEYDNTQNDANHIHAVWRDFDGDFGEDPLLEHYEHGHHHDHH